jgi:hypothetical protein
MLATELVGDVARAIAGPGMQVMPVKGALLQHWLYEDPAERPMTDVDLLVRPDDFGSVVECLEAAGYRRTRHRSVGGIVMETPFGLALDLHSQLFDCARYRMPTADLFARSSEDHVLYGASVQIPSPLDVYAHLIGKFGSDHLDGKATARLDEIARMETRLDASPEAVARHLVLCGMRRASRYVLPLVHRAVGGGFALRVYDSLPFDPMGRGVAATANLLLAGAAPGALGGALVAHMLNDSLPRGVHSGARALLQRARRSGRDGANRAGPRGPLGGWRRNAARRDGL